jgi:hypothetical protein
VLAAAHGPAAPVRESAARGRGRVPRRGDYGGDEQVVRTVRQLAEGGGGGGRAREPHGSVRRGDMREGSQRTQQEAEATAAGL